jgi:hypothetical protein
VLDAIDDNTRASSLTNPSQEEDATLRLKEYTTHPKSETRRIPPQTLFLPFEDDLRLVFGEASNEKIPLDEPLAGDVSEACLGDRLNIMSKSCV